MSVYIGGIQWVNGVIWGPPHWSSPFKKETMTGIILTVYLCPERAPAGNDWCARAWSTVSFMAELLTGMDEIFNTKSGEWESQQLTLILLIHYQHCFSTSTPNNSKSGAEGEECDQCFSLGFPSSRLGTFKDRDQHQSLEYVLVCMLLADTKHRFFWPLL